MDQNPDQNVDQDSSSEPAKTESSLGEKASSLGQGLKQGANTAKDIIGAAKGGSGDGIAGGIGGGGLGKAANGALNALSGKRGDNSGDGMIGKGATRSSGPSLPNKSSEESASPEKRNNLSDDKNPSARDFAKKAAMGSETGKQIADTVETGKNLATVGTAVAQGGVNIANDAKAVKAAFDLAKDPEKTGKAIVTGGLAIAAFFLLQIMVAMAIVGTLFFAIYKVAITFTGVIPDPTQVATELRVNNEMARWLIKSAPQTAYQRDLANAKKSGSVIAQSPPPNIEIPTSPETARMHEAWSEAGLQKKFVEDYGAELRPANGRPQSTSTKLSDWDLYANGVRIGTLNSTRAQAYISVFTSDVTKWDKIYTRKMLQNTAKKSFEIQSFKLDLPDPENNIEKSRENINKQIISSTLKPIETRSEMYYECIVVGSTSCTRLGLGTSEAPANVSSPESKGFFGSIINSIRAKREENRVKLIEKKVSKGDLSAYTTSIIEGVDIESVGYANKDRLAAQVRTGASETILNSIKKAPDGSPDPEVAIGLYEQFQIATDNGNFSRTNYDREAWQSIGNAMNYFVAGGQLLNKEMSLFDSWALTENLSNLEESPSFRAALIGEPVGVFAQGSPAKSQTCQNIYNDDRPVGKASDNIDRPIKETACFSRSLTPDISEFKREKSYNKIYALLEQRNSEYDSTLGAAVGGWISSLYNQIFQKYINKEVRTSPVTTSKVAADSSLGPEFDAYINQVYGVSRTGAEVNGEAFDTMLAASEALWSQAGTDGQYGIGGSYQSDEEVAKMMRYSRSIEREKMAFRPLSERLFAIKDHRSLAGKLALLTPSNSKDMANKTLALFNTSNLTGAVASRLIPPTFADDIKDENPAGAVRTGYPLGHASNTMNGQQISEKYNCSNGGPTQEKGQPEGIPFTVPVTTNPCKREAVIANVATCYLDNEDSCGFGEIPQTLTVPPGGAAKGVDTSGLPCAGTPTAERIVEIATGTKRKLCDYGAVLNVDASWSPNVSAMLEDAKGEISLSGNGFRTAESQIALRKKHCGSSQYDIYEKPARNCRPPTAIPGRSNHELGLAIDFNNCSSRESACFRWLAANANKHGVINLPSEPWHWSVNGG